MIKEAIIVLIMLSSIPVGLLLRKLTKDEIEAGRAWFKSIYIASLVISLILGIVYLIFSANELIPVIFAFFYFFIVSFISSKKKIGKINL